MRATTDSTPLNGLDEQKASAHDLMKYAFDASTEYVRGLDNRSVVPSEHQLAALSRRVPQRPRQS